jgi:hypothetical protein
VAGLTRSLVIWPLSRRRFVPGKRPPPRPPAWERWLESVRALSGNAIAMSDDPLQALRADHEALAGRMKRLEHDW